MEKVICFRFSGNNAPIFNKPIYPCLNAAFHIHLTFIKKYGMVYVYPNERMCLVWIFVQDSIATCFPFIA